MWIIAQMDSLTTWAQVGFFICVSLAAVVYSVSHLFRSMTTSYGAIITALQSQNAGQQQQINTLMAEVADLLKEVAGNKKTILEVAEKVNGGSK